MIVAEKDFVESHFLDSVADYSGHEAAPQAGAAPTESAADPHEVSLSRRDLRQQLEGWWLASPTGAGLCLVPENIVGSIVRCRRGNSSPIVGFDPASHRVVTRSGHVYGLGMPEAAFAARARQVLRRMGF